MLKSIFIFRTLTPNLLAAKFNYFFLDLLERSLKSINENNDFKLPEIILVENDNEKNYLYRFSYIGDKNDLQYLLMALKKRARNIKTIVNNEIIELESVPVPVSNSQEDSRNGKTMIASSDEENYYTNSRRNDKILDVEGLNHSDAGSTIEPNEFIRKPRRNDKYLILDLA